MGMFILVACLLLGLALALPVAAQASFTPAAIPIAARSPYLLNFLPTYASKSYSSQWQEGYSYQIQAWTGLIRVDGKTYVWAGSINSRPKGNVDPVQTGNGATLTPTRSVFAFQAGPMQLTVTFLSPIEPGDLVKQSIPASYVALDVHSIDGASHSIQVYTDITAEWVTGDRSQNVTWSTNATDPDMVYHTISAVNQSLYQEVKAQSAWGSIYYAAPRASGMTFASGSNASRDVFAQNGTLFNTQNTTFRPITMDFPLFAFAQDLGNIQQTSAPLVWAVANIRDSNVNGAIRYTDLSRPTQTRNLFYRSQYSDDGTLLRDFLADFPAALNRSQALDKNITQAAMTVGGPPYADILAVATRQAYCGIEVTVGHDADGNVNASDVMAFYRDTGIYDGSNENVQVSPVDGLISVFPAFLYLDPTLCGALLEPLLRFQNDPSYTNPYAALKMGVQYPLAAASGESHAEGIETSSGMIIMAYGHAKATGDHRILTTYYALLKKWADFLTSNTLSTTGQTSADNNPLTGQSNLAIKGIIAIQAMSHISALLNDFTSRDAYLSQSQTLYSQWLEKALAADGHLRFSYDEPDSSFSLGYNMFWDLALETGLLNTTIIDAQIGYIAKSIQPFGVATDSTNTSMVSTNWNMLAAAIATQDMGTQQAIIGATHKLASLQLADTFVGQFPLMYTAQNGTIITGWSSPRQGAAYAPLLVKASSFLSGSNGSVAAPTGKKNRAGIPVGAIVGATLGAVAVLFLLAGLFFLRRRRSSATRKVLALQADPSIREAILGDTSPVAHAPGVTPFMTVDSSPPLPSVSESSNSSEDWTRGEADTKRAYRLRRIPNEELQQHAPMANVPQADATQPSIAPLAASEQSDPAYGPGLLREISSLRQEVLAMRMTDGMMAPPEYNA